MNATPRNASLHKTMKLAITEIESYITALIKEYDIKHPSVLILDQIEGKMIEAIDLIETLPGDEDPK